MLHGRIDYPDAPDLRRTPVETRHPVVTEEEPAGAVLRLMTDDGAVDQEPVVAGATAVAPPALPEAHGEPRDSAAAS
jgi:hypothetical protein